MRVITSPAIGSALALALGLVAGCSDTQPRNACSVQGTSGRYGVGGFNAKYTALSVTGTGCKGLLGVEKAGDVIGETLGVGLFGRLGDTLALKPLSAGYAASGDGVGLGKFVTRPDAAGACSAASLEAGKYVVSDPSWVGPEPLPDPAPVPPNMEVAYAFSNVHFVQASNIPGTQLTGALAVTAGPAAEGDAGASTCDATFTVDGIWAAAGYLRCETDADCDPKALEIPGKPEDYACIDQLPLLVDEVPDLDDKGEAKVDGDGNPLTKYVTGRRCVAKSPVPIGAIPFPGVKP